MSLSKLSHLALSPLHCPGCDRPPAWTLEVSPPKPNNKFIRMGCSENHTWSLGAFCPDCKRMAVVDVEDGVPVLLCCTWKTYIPGYPRVRPCPKCSVLFIEVRLVNPVTAPEGGGMALWCEDCGTIDTAGDNAFAKEVEL